MTAYGPWVPMMIVQVLIPFAYVILLFIPETLKRKVDEAVIEERPTFLQAAKSHIKESFLQVAESTVILKDSKILLFLPVFMIQPTVFAAYGTILPQYISAHFGWRLADTAYLLSPLSVLNLVILIALPVISAILMSPKRKNPKTAFQKDAIILAFSLGFAMTGAMIEFFSRTVSPFIFGLFVGMFGAANSPVARSLITQFVDTEHTARLYALIATSETIGTLIGSPVVAWCFDIGLRNKSLMGLPYLYVEILFLITAACAFIALRKASHETLPGYAPVAPEGAIECETDADTDDEAETTDPIGEEPNRTGRVDLV
jgi:MFS transporter, PCFT/HCP family, solute carrier family 46 (folate transporter), member 1